MHVLVGPAATTPLVGASGAIFGVMAVAGALRPRLLGFIVAFVGINVFHAFAGGSGNVSFGCHIGGFVAGFLVVVLLRAVGSEALEAA
jgi:membrane associated rhomboid family serine protease